MEPQTYTYNTYDNVSNKRTTRLIVVVGIVIAAIGWGVWHVVTSAPPVGTVKVMYTPADAEDVKITFNGNGVAAKDSPPTYSLKPGNYQLHITTPGYKEFSATVPVVHNQTVLVNAQLVATAKSTIDSPSDIWLPSELEGTSVTITSTEYFYNNSWAVLHINTKYDTGAVLVVQHDQNTGKWRPILGPGLAFSETALSPLPPLVQQYITDNDLVVGED